MIIILFSDVSAAEASGFPSLKKLEASEGSGDSNQISLSTLISTLEQSSGIIPPLFSKAASEEKFVKTQILLNRELRNSISNERITHVGSIEIPEGESVTIIVIMTPNSTWRPTIQVFQWKNMKLNTNFKYQGKPRKHDAKIFIRLGEFDRDINQPQYEQLLQGSDSLIPVRELMIRCSLCRSILELGQRNINFGFLDKNEPRTKTIVIRNKSEIPLLYSIRKSGSIASGDLIIVESRTGLVRGYGQKEIEFVFDPSLPGAFNERLTIENVQDKENDQFLVIKASIRQPSKFSVETASVEFGDVKLNHVVRSIDHIIVTNTTKQPRTLEIRADFGTLPVEFLKACVFFEVLEDVDENVDDPCRKGKRKAVLLSKEMEDKIEALEQKLKIAKRKGNKDKVDKILAKLINLRAGKTESTIGTEGDGSLEDSTAIKEQGQAFETSDAADTVAKSGTFEAIHDVGEGSVAGAVPPAVDTYIRPTANHLTFVIQPRSIVTLTASLFCAINLEVRNVFIFAFVFLYFLSCFCRFWFPFN